MFSRFALQLRRGNYSRLSHINMRFMSTEKVNVSSIPLPSDDPALLGKGAKKADNLETATPLDVEDDEDSGPYINPQTGEVDGPRGPEPTRYGDFERGGRCYDF